MESGGRATWSVVRLSFAHPLISSPVMIAVPNSAHPLTLTLSRHGESQATQGNIMQLLAVR